jgi:hypothetical protein
MVVNFGVNYVAVVVAAVVALVIGFIWYSPRVFGSRWMAYLGTTQAQLGNPGPTGMAVGVVASLVNAWVLAVLSLNLCGATLTDGVLLGVLAWLGSWRRSRPRRSRSREAVGPVGPEQRSQPAGAGNHGCDRDRLALTVGR